MIKKAIPELKSSHWIAIWRSFGVVLTLFVIVIFHARWRTGSNSLVLPYLAGNSIVFKQPEIFIGELKQNEEVEITLHVVNLRSVPVSLIGAYKTCRCLSLDQFPIIVPPGVEHPIKMKLVVPGKPSSFSIESRFYTSDPGYLPVAVRIKGVAR